MSEATDRALSMIGVSKPYILGTGDYQPDAYVDEPWTNGQWTDASGLVHTGRGSDCAGFAISWCHKLVRHRPGFNRGAWATVSDDLNTDSAVEDAQHAQELFDPVVFPSLSAAVLPGDLLVYKTIHLPGHPRPWIGHVSIVLAVGDGFDPARPDWTKLTVAQCCGGNGRMPAVIESDGAIWAQHDHVWGDVDDRRAVVIRVKV